jgi:hypothetical protein
VLKADELPSGGSKKKPVAITNRRKRKSVSAVVDKNGMIEFAHTNNLLVNNSMDLASTSNDTSSNIGTQLFTANESIGPRENTKSRKHSLSGGSIPSITTSTTSATYASSPSSSKSSGSVSGHRSRLKQLDSPGLTIVIPNNISASKSSTAKSTKKIAKSSNGIERNLSTEPRPSQEEDNLFTDPLFPPSAPLSRPSPGIILPPTWDELQPSMDPPHTPPHLHEMPMVLRRPYLRDKSISNASSPSIGVGGGLPVPGNGKSPLLLHTLGEYGNLKTLTLCPSPTIVLTPFESF